MGRTGWLEWVRDRLAGGVTRRMSRTADRLATAFAETRPDGTPTDKAVRGYRHALKLALRVDSKQAEALFRTYDARIAPERYPLTAADEPWLAESAAHADSHVLPLLFDVATRLQLPGLQIRARDRMAEHLGEDADQIVVNFHRWQEQGLLTADTMTAVLSRYAERGSFEQDDRMWRLFFEHLPAGLRPDLFEVHCFLGHGADAVRLAGTPAQVDQALACCLRSPDIGDAEAGLALARDRAGTKMVSALAEHLADLLFEDQQYERALVAYQECGRQDQVSRCHEELGQFLEALASCPDSQTERLVTLAVQCGPAIHLLVEHQEFVEAARQTQDVLAHLARATENTEALARRQEEMADLRATLLGSTRRHLGERLRLTEPGSAAQQAVNRMWSRFEEAAGELGLAARRAEDGGEYFRANRLFVQAQQFGEAVRVLRDDNSAEGLAGRAEACEVGGDLAGAARLYAQIGQRERAVSLFMKASEYAEAAWCLIEWLGAAAAEDTRLAECLRRAGEYGELTRRCLAAIEARGSSSLAVTTLRQLTDDGLVPQHMTTEVSSALEAMGTRDRRSFEERAQGWVSRARAEIDKRFSDIWGFDLGTTTCAAAIYDSQTRQPVFCPWKGAIHFASTVSLDRQGDELVGLSGEETLAPWLIGHIEAAKRAMGRRTVYKIRDRSYRPEEVAARLIRHARGLVETFLAGQVRERVGDLARAELGVVHEDWLSWAERNHDLRLDRPRVVVTIPAYFRNNQKAATYSACRIAGVDLVRLIHEPTAACITAARERRLGDTIAVVDLGAGTLDISLVEVGDQVYDVLAVGGDNQFGGKDLDAAITQALTTRLERQGIAVPKGGSVRRRLEIAAESLKVDLSAQEHATYDLVSFHAGGDVRLELSRAELADILAGPLATLREACAGFLSSAPEHTKHLVLVGRPMLSPLVRETVEQVFGVTRTVVSDPRTAVAAGAALLGAMRDGSLDDVLLLDVTPLALGIRIVDEHDKHHLSELIPRNATIPTSRSDVYTTHDDDQTVVRIEIFNGALDPESKIGQFELTGIPPAEKGVAKIEVTFEIDANCMLSVTAKDKATGKANSIRVADTTLLSPGEIADLTRRYERQLAEEQRLRDLADSREQLRALAESTMDDDSAGAWQEFRHRQATHRPAPGTQDAETQRLLVEMFSEAGQTELDVDLARRAVRDAALAVLDHLDRPADSAETTRLGDDLRERIAELHRLTTKIARWNAVLVRLAMNEPDPLLRFRGHCAAGDYRQALAALAELPAPPTNPDDIRRHARCLAEVGDADGYRALRSAHVDRPGAVPTGLVRIQVNSRSGIGFLIQERLVVTSRSLFTGDEIDRQSILVDAGTGGTKTVERVLTGDDVVVLRLAQPVTASPLPLGYSKLVRIGDQIWAPQPSDGSPSDGSPSDGSTASWTHTVGLVDRFDSVAALRLFVLSLQIPPSCSGAPVLNDLGEVVGIVTDSGSRVLSVDALDPLLAEAGFDR